MQVDHPKGGVPAARERLDSLDGLRGYLSLYVCMYHLTNSFQAFADWGEGHAAVLRNGWFAVDVFFVMSGFVMVYVYGDHFKRGRLSAAMGAYLWARIARLYPVQIVTFAILFVAVGPFVYRSDLFLDPAGRFYWGAAIANLFMLQGPWIDHRNWNYPSWSISAEMHAYLLFPILLPAIRMRAGALAILLLCVAATLVIYLSGASVDTYPTNGILVLIRACLLFAAGMALFRLRKITGCIGSGLTFGIVGLLVVILSVPAVQPFATCLAPILVIASLGPNRLRLFLGNPFALYLGRVSFSLYMVHGVVQILLIDRMRAGFHLEGSVWIAAACVIAGCIISLAAADQMQRWVEAPARDALKDWFAGRNRESRSEPQVDV